MDKELKDFFSEQLDCWEEAKMRYEQLENVATKTLDLSHFSCVLQYNPYRILSANASVDKQSIEKRPCFLCKNNRPESQMELALNTEFTILINPFPILKHHFTIPINTHSPQQILPYINNVYALIERNERLTVFYNGPDSGASAPDHMHLQAVLGQDLPIQRQWEGLVNTSIVLFEDKDDAILYIKDYPAVALCVISKTSEDSINLFKRVYNSLREIGYNTKKTIDISSEPMMNIVAWKQNDTYYTVIFPRKQHRPKCYYAEGDEKKIISPGALDMVGLIITPRKEDFETLTSEEIQAVYEDVSLEKACVSELKKMLFE